MTLLLAVAIFTLGLIFGAIITINADHAILKNQVKEEFTKSQAVLTIAKLAKLQSISSNVEEIKKFLEENVALLSTGDVDLLISRIELLNADRSIDKHSLKQRVNLFPFKEKFNEMSLLLNGDEFGDNNKQKEVK